MIGAAARKRRSRATSGNASSMTATALELPTKLNTSSLKKKAKQSQLHTVPLELVLNPDETFARIYSALYSSPGDNFELCINAKKLEEADASFSRALAQGRDKRWLVVVKGPPGCGKTLLIHHLLDKYKSQVQIDHWNEEDGGDFFSSDSYPYSSPSVLDSTKCRKSLFPSLQFSMDNSSQQSFNRDLISVTWLTDVLIQCDYSPMKQKLDRLTTLKGVIIFEACEYSDMTEDCSQARIAFALKLLYQAFTRQSETITLNASTATNMKKMLQSFRCNFDVKDLIQYFRGDARAFLHDLMFWSVSESQTFFSVARDFHTEFFHYVGKMLYPCKDRAKRIIDDEIFWDCLNYSNYISFLQFHLPKFTQSIAGISSAWDQICSNDAVSWAVSNHVSMQSPQVAIRFAPLLSIFAIINSEPQIVASKTFHSFSKPTPIVAASKTRADETYLKEFILQHR